MNDVPRSFSFVLAALALAGCSNIAGCSTNQAGRSDTSPTSPAEEYAVTADQNGLTLSLSEVDQTPDELVRPRLAAGTPLGDDDASRLLGRLPDLPDADGDESEFAFRKRSKPAPRTGQSVATAFPPKQTDKPPAPGQSGPPELSRHAPDGDVDLAPKVSLTFSEPMVAVTGQQDASRTTPATITPDVDGRWRWIGTRTALFEPSEERLPMATDFQVRTAESLTSATGDALDKPADFAFSTPPVQITRHYPSGGPTRLRPVIFLEFNQRIEPTELIDHVLIKADGDTYDAVRASDEQIQRDDAVKQLADRGRPNQWLAFRPDTDLPPATKVTVGLQPGAPSAEGPKLTDSAQTHRFRTYDSLSVRQHNCTDSDKCPPGSPWWITMNNPLDTDHFSADLIHVEPDLPSMEVNATRSSIQISGASQPRTTYEVTLAAGLQDRYGQKLGTPKTVAMHIGQARPRLGSSAGVLSVLDPAARGRFPVYSINYDAFRVRAYQVSPPDWDDYLAFLDQRGDTDQARPPGQKVIDTQIEVDADNDELTTTHIDLTKPLGADGHGQLVVIVEPADVQPDDSRRRPTRDVITWVQITDIALDAFRSNQSLLTWVSALADGAPLEGVDLSLLSGSHQTSNASGLARFGLPDDSSAPKLADGNLLVARKGDDVAILPEHTSPWRHGQSNWVQRSQAPDMLWHVFDDRGMYKPGETAHFKGWLRLSNRARPRDDSAGGRLELSDVTEIHYEVYDSRNNKITSGEANTTNSGGFNFAVDLPDTINLGRARVQLLPSAGLGPTLVHSFRIQEFRRPEFEVNVTTPAGPHLVGEATTATVEANYYAGGGLAGASVQWSVRTHTGQYTPPNRDAYNFGRYKPWWMPSWLLPQPKNDAHLLTLGGHTDATGQHHLKLGFDSVNPPLPTVVEPDGAVTDVNRQTWSDSTHLLVHPARVYVGLRSPNNFVARGDGISIDAIVTDIDGGLVAGRPVDMTAERMTWRYENGERRKVAHDKQTCSLTSANAPQTCTFEAEQAGRWRISAVTKDADGRPNLSQMVVWVAGGDIPPNRRADHQEVNLIPDRQSYEAGDTAKILVQAPFGDAHGLMTIRQNGLVSRKPFDVDGHSHTLAIPITEADYPNVHIQVDLVGAEPRRNEDGQSSPDAGNRPAYATGTISLKVPPRSRTLSVDVTPKSKELSPGVNTTVDITVTDADGAAAEGAEVAFVAVDEAILALSDYELADPIESFYPSQTAGVDNHYLRRHLVLTTLGDMPGPKGERQGHAPASGDVQRRTMAMMESGAPAKPSNESAADATAPAIALRKDFRPLVLFAPEVTTDANGKATVDLDLPDNLTRFRLMAVAVHGDDHFGTGQSTLTTRLPLMVRPSPPRFLNWGDHIEMPVVVHNQTDADQSVDVAVRAANLRLGEVTAKNITVPARDRVEVRFEALTQAAGKATIQVAASAGKWADSAQNQLPVWTPATTEAFAAYGTIDKGGLTQPVAPPSDAIDQFGGLQVSTSSTALQELTDALLFLVDSPFDSAEYLASRILGIASLKDVLGAFDAAELPDADQLTDAVARDIQTLQQLQRPDGGFDLWSSRDRHRYPFVSIHVAHALQRAKMKGFSVPDAVLDGALRFARTIDSHIPADYNETTQNAVRAYAYRVLDLAGIPIHSTARKLAAETPGDNLSLEAVGWLMSTLADDTSSASRLGELQQYLQNKVAETAATAQFTTSYGGQNHLLMYSGRRTDAIILDALMAAAPKSDLIAKVVHGLLAHRTRGHWANTQENAFVLGALDRYFHTYEDQTPNFVARMWLGDGYIGRHRYRGRTTDRKHVDIPMKTVAHVADDADKDPQANLIVQKRGEGRLYYRIGMRYAPASLEVDPVDNGFAVERRYEAVDDADDVTQSADGVWHIEPGARVRVRLTMVAPARRYHVALVDPLPAGLEALNPALAVTEPIPADAQDKQPSHKYWWWFRPWYSHQNLRDERVEAFSPLVWAGVHEYTYVARATVPGEFIAPPTKAEEMYHPETFGRTGTDHISVE